MQIVKNSKTAMVFGASGLVGGFVVQNLLDSEAYDSVIAFNRQNLKLSHSKLEQIQIDFDRPDLYAPLVKGDDLFCCLGTTMRKAGSKEAFYRVDFQYCYDIAQMALKNKVNQFLLVSAVDADEDSVFYYNQVKGKLESVIKNLPFWGVHIFQPSILLGERNENRFGERIAQKIGKIIDSVTGNLLSKYRPIEAESVAKAMIQAAQGLQGGVFVYPSHAMHE